MASSRANGADRRQPRLWSFAGCTFDEPNWKLIVEGRSVPIETKPLELLRELLIHDGNVVSKDALFDHIWPDVTVVEASLPTAVHKLRQALGDDRGDRCIIETVPGIGYRLAVPVAVETLPRGVKGPLHAGGGGVGGQPAARRTDGGRRWIAGGLAVVLIVAVAAPQFQARDRVMASAAPRYTQRDQLNALRRLDVDAVERMLAAGWDPNHA